MPGDHGTWLGTWKALVLLLLVRSSNFQMGIPISIWCTYLAQWTLFVHLSGVIEEPRISKGGIQACVGGFC